MKIWFDVIGLRGTGTRRLAGRRVLLEENRALRRRLAELEGQLDRAGVELSGVRLDLEEAQATSGHSLAALAAAVDEKHRVEAAVTRGGVAALFLEARRRVR